jgi:hypothetical protein
MAEETMNVGTPDTTSTVSTDNKEGNPQQVEDQNKNVLSTEALEKLIQSRVDKITAELGKKNSSLQKELDKVRKEKLTDDEIKKIELADKEKELSAKETAILERENRLFAIKAMKEIGLDDGSNTSLALVDFVMAKDEETITERVKTLKSLIDKLVSSKVDQTFKANGRVPNGGSQKGSGEGEQDISVAEKLGKVRAEQQKQSNNVLKYYLGGN